MSGLPGGAKTTERELDCVREKEKEGLGTIASRDRPQEMVGWAGGPPAKMAESH